jgi:lipopolysaccharide export system protein LptA
MHGWFWVCLNTFLASPAPVSALDFRCDAMQVHTDPNKTICTGHVVIRKDSVLVCCDTFVGLANSRWEWEHLTCKGDVRAVREGETAWGDEAEFSYTSNDVLLRGNPVLKRGESLLFGDTINIRTDTKKAHVIRPRGLLVTKDKPGVAVKSYVKGKLPSKCPVEAYRGQRLP